MGKKKVAPIAGWDKAAYQIEAWAVFCKVFLRDDGVHPTMYEMLLLLEETSGVSPRMRAQVRQKPTLPSDLIRLIQHEFKESFLQVLERRQRVWWPNF